MARTGIGLGRGGDVTTLFNRTWRGGGLPSSSSLVLSEGAWSSTQLRPFLSYARGELCHVVSPADEVARRTPPPHLTRTHQVVQYNPGGLA